MKLNHVIGCLFTLFLSQSGLAMTAAEIADKVGALPTPSSAHSELVMKIYKGSDIAEKEFTIDGKKISDKESRLLVNFTKPTGIKFLMHSHKDGEDDQWIKMSSGQVKRIGSSSKGSSFVNSHFSYEDLSTRERHNYKYELLGEEKVSDADCYKLETTRIKGKDSYDKIISYVRKNDYFIVKSDFYQKGKLYKVLENSDIKEVKGILTPYKVVMKLSENGDKTEMTLKSVDYNMNIKDAEFAKESL